MDVRSESPASTRSALHFSPSLKPVWLVLNCCASRVGGGLTNGQRCVKVMDKHQMFCCSEVNIYIGYLEEGRVCHL
jgi:hypothetical protein